MQFDHIIAFSKKGGADIDNIQHLCRVHNAYKGMNWKRSRAAEGLVCAPAGTWEDF